MGCLLLAQPFFWAQEQWLPPLASWPRSTQRGARYNLSNPDKTPGRNGRRHGRLRTEVCGDPRAAAPGVRCRAHQAVPDGALPFWPQSAVTKSLLPYRNTNESEQRYPFVVSARACGTYVVPRVDADGNDVAGIRSTALEAPVRTYMGLESGYRARGTRRPRTLDARGGDVRIRTAKRAHRRGRGPAPLIPASKPMSPARLPRPSRGR